MTKLKLLEELDIRKNNLTALPDAIYGYDILIIDSKQLAKFPREELRKCYGQNQDHAEIILQLNDIIGEPIGRVISLRNSNHGVLLRNNIIIGLDLYDTGLEQFPEMLTQIGSLKILKIRTDLDLILSNNVYTRRYVKRRGWKLFNKLESVPKSIKELTSLEYLNLDGNNFHSFPEEITNIKSLKVLEICANSIKTLPKSLLTMPNLEKLRIDHNSIDEDHAETYSVLKDLRERKILYFP